MAARKKLETWKVCRRHAQILFRLSAFNTKYQNENIKSVFHQSSSEEVWSLDGITHGIWRHRLTVHIGFLSIFHRRFSFDFHHSRVFFGDFLSSYMWPEIVSILDGEDEESWRHQSTGWSQKWTIWCFYLKCALQMFLLHCITIHVSVCISKCCLFMSVF